MNIKDPIVKVLNSLLNNNLDKDKMEVIRDYFNDTKDCNLSNRGDRYEFCLKMKNKDEFPMTEDDMAELDVNVNTRLFFKDDFDIDYNVEGEEDVWGFFFNITPEFREFLMKRVFDSLDSGH